MLQCRWSWKYVNTERGPMQKVALLYARFHLHVVSRTQSVYRDRDNQCCLGLEAGAMMYRQAWGISWRLVTVTSVVPQQEKEKRKTNSSSNDHLTKLLYFIDQSTGLDIYDALREKAAGSSVWHTMMVDWPWVWPHKHKGVMCLQLHPSHSQNVVPVWGTELSFDHMQTVQPLHASIWIPVWEESPRVVKKICVTDKETLESKGILEISRNSLASRLLAFTLNGNHISL